MFVVVTVEPPKQKAESVVGAEVFCAVLVVVAKAKGFAAASVVPLKVLVVAILPNTLADCAVDTIGWTIVDGAEVVVELVAVPKVYVPVATVLKVVAAVVFAFRAGVAMLPPKLNVGLATAALVLIAFAPNAIAGFAASEETGVDVVVIEFPKLPNADTAGAVVTVVETSGFGVTPNLNPPALTDEVTTSVFVIGVAVVEVVFVGAPNENP